MGSNRESTAKGGTNTELESQTQEAPPNQAGEALAKSLLMVAGLEMELEAAKKENQRLTDELADMTHSKIAAQLAWDRTEAARQELERRLIDDDDEAERCVHGVAHGDACDRCEDPDPSSLPQYNMGRYQHLVRKRRW